MVLSADIEWLDADRFIVDSAFEFGLTVPAGTQREFDGVSLIEADVAESIEGMEVEVSTRGF